VLPYRVALYLDRWVRRRARSEADSSNGLAKIKAANFSACNGSSNDVCSNALEKVAARLLVERYLVRAGAAERAALSSRSSTRSRMRISRLAVCTASAASERSA
jgi:hypothetical protein